MNFVIPEMVTALEGEGEELEIIMAAMTNLCLLFSVIHAV